MTAEGRGGADQRGSKAERGALGEEAPELVQERLVEEKVEVLYMVVGLIDPVRFFLGLAGVNAFEDAEPPAAGRDERRRGSVRSCCRSASLLRPTPLLLMLMLLSLSG